MNPFFDALKIVQMIRPLQFGRLSFALNPSETKDGLLSRLILRSRIALRVPADVIHMDYFGVTFSEQPPNSLMD